jgi:Metalloenzyme superfamily
LTVYFHLNNLIVGWGISPADGNPKGDAIKNAKTPVMDTFEETYPFCELEAHGNAVGLPDGLMGNSEGSHPQFHADESWTFEYWCREGCLAGTVHHIELTSGSRAH